MESSVYTLLENLEDLLDKAKQAPLSSSVKVSKEEILEIIDGIRLALPQEIKQAQRIVHNSESIIDNAHASAQGIINAAEETAEKMTMSHEITKRAQEEAEAIINDARGKAEDMRLGAIEYADQMLANTESKIKAVLDNLSKRTNNVLDFLSKETDAIFSEREALRELFDQAPQDNSLSYEEVNALPYNNDSDN